MPIVAQVVNAVNSFLDLWWLNVGDCVARTNQREYMVSSDQRHQKSHPMKGWLFWCTRLEIWQSQGVAPQTPAIQKVVFRALRGSREPTKIRCFERPKTPKKPPHEGMAVLVYPIGFEPTAPSVGGLCSIQLSYGYILYYCSRFFGFWQVFL